MCKLVLVFIAQLASTFGDHGRKRTLYPRLKSINQFTSMLLTVSFLWGRLVSPHHTAFSLSVLWEPCSVPGTQSLCVCVCVCAFIFPHKEIAMLHLKKVFLLKRVVEAAYCLPLEFTLVVQWWHYLLHKDTKPVMLVL